MYWSRVGAALLTRPSASSAIPQSRSCTTVPNGGPCVRFNLPRILGALSAARRMRLSWQQRSIISSHIMAIHSCSLTQVICNLFASHITPARLRKKFGMHDHHVYLPPQKKFRAEGLERRWRERVKESPIRFLWFLGLI